MKRFLLIIVFVILMVTVQPAFASFEEKTLFNEQYATYITINPDRFVIDYIEYDTIKVICIKTGKEHIFKLDNDCYQSELGYYYDASVINYLTRIDLFDIIKIPFLA